ncbi:uncharacterized protein LOC131429830 [Malaya genurostris]|uniref:uncharacterized protein LOC131429830 n=1 Tax=Malaya genurostris TaxID=325434 RepID=UPI0026F37DBD|nr:uncharacterized protein LOC131429830 [Malaya genurostris]
MSRCCVISCLNKRSEKQVKFFNFPTDPTICSQWVEFCHCPETLRRFEEGGSTAMRKFAICSEHFEPTLVKTAGKGHLPNDAVPDSIGTTYMTPTMLREKGFNIEEVPVKNEPVHEIFLDATYAPDEFLVEMLCPEEINEESDNDIMSMTANSLDTSVSQSTEQERSITPTASIVSNNIKQNSIYDKHASVKCKGFCKSSYNFRSRYETQRNKNREIQVSIEKSKIRLAKMTAKVQKMADKVALKRQKRDQLNERYKEMQKLKEDLSLASIMDVDESEDEADFDESKAWW